MRICEQPSTSDAETLLKERGGYAQHSTHGQPALERFCVKVSATFRDCLEVLADPVPRRPVLATTNACAGDINDVLNLPGVARAPSVSSDGPSLGRAVTRSRVRLQANPTSVAGAGFRLLLVDDDVLARHKANEALELPLGAFTRSVGSAIEALDAVTTERFDAIILEVGLPDGDGCELCATIRRLGMAMPIVMLTRLGQVDDVVRGLDAGAHDYVVKPFRPYEFAARVRAQLHLSEVGGHVQVRVGDQMFHSGKRTLSKPGRSRLVRLTVKESAVLRYLHNANGEKVSRKELLHHVWGYNDGAETNTVASHLYRLRRKVEPRGDSPRVLVYEPGGYRLLRTVTMQTTSAAPERQGKLLGSVTLDASRPSV